MKRGWFLILSLSVGLNAGLLYTLISKRNEVRSCLAQPLVLTSEELPALGTGQPGPPCLVLEGQGLAARRIACMAQWLRLDDGQCTQMRTIVGEMLPRILAERDAVLEARRTARAGYFAEGVDAASIRERVRHLNQAQARLDSLVAETMLRETALLTPEQRARYLEGMSWDRWLDRGPQPGPPRRPGPG